MKFPYLPTPPFPHFSTPYTPHPTPHTLHPTSHFPTLIGLIIVG
ncbi:hypothetical protein [Microcystis sp. LE19-59.1C]|nr:hypothetical protein [Microcystis sp. LE19-59.1C]